jgi:hypothetical protein
MINAVPPVSSVSQTEDRENNHTTQSRAFYLYLKENTTTCSMASEALKIPQKCLTRYKRDLELSGNLWEVYEGICQLTGFYAAYLTTNPDLAPSKPKPLTLFDNE